jgi:hypothetical protein
VVIEAEDPRPVGTLANIRDQPIRVRKDEEWIWYSAHEQPEEFLRFLHRMYHGSYLWVTSVDVSSVGGQRLLSNQPFFG